MKTQLMFRQQNGKLGKVSFDNLELDIQAVQNQLRIRSEVVSLGKKLKPKTPVLCLIVC